MATRTANVNGLNLVYEHEGSGPPIVFLHTFTGSASQFETLIPFLTDDYTCIAVELRGHGRSDRSPEGHYITKHMVAEATAFIEQVAGTPAVLLGQSWGANVAFGVAAQRPDLVRAIYSDEAVPVNLVLDGSNERALGIMGLVGDAVSEKHREGLSFLQFANRLAAKLPRWAAMDPAGLVGFARLVAGSDPALYAAIGNPDNSWSPEEALAIERAVRCPVHVARGDAQAGSIVTEGHVDDLRNAGLHITSTHFPGAGHMARAYTPAMIDDVRAFLQRAGL